MQVIYFFYHLSKFFSKFRVCSFYDANEAHQIRKPYIFLVHNFEYYRKRGRVPLRGLYKVPLASETPLQFIGSSSAGIPRLTAIAVKSTQGPP
jgi:hypothetical protein